MNTFHDFKNAIGEKFKIPGFLYDKWDTVIAVNEEEQTVEGNIVSAHFTDCRLKQEQPPQFKKKK